MYAAVSNGSSDPVRPKKSPPGNQHRAATLQGNRVRQLFFFARPPDDRARLATPPDDRLALPPLARDAAPDRAGAGREAVLDRAGAGRAEPLERAEPTPLEERDGTARETPAEPERDGTARLELPEDDPERDGTTRVEPAEDDPERDGTTRVELPDELDGRGTARDATPDEPDRDGTTRVLLPEDPLDGTTRVEEEDRPATPELDDD